MYLQELIFATEMATFELLTKQTRSYNCAFSWPVLRLSAPLSVHWHNKKVRRGYCLFLMAECAGTIMIPEGHCLN